MSDDTHQWETAVRPGRCYDLTTEITSNPHRNTWTGPSVAPLIEAALRMEAEPDTSIRLVLLAGTGLGVRDLRWDCHDYLVIGRHRVADLSTCDHCEAMSLRHVLAIPRPALGLLELVPLHPTFPVLRADHLLPQWLRDRGEAYTLGDALLFVVALDRARPNLTVLGVGTTHVDASEVGIDIQPAASAPIERRTHLTAAPLVASEQAPIPPAQGSVVLEVSGATLRVSLHLREQWLDDGILLGRSQDKSTHEALGLALSSEFISRAHLLLRREGGHLVFYDLSSTGGSYVSGVEIHRLELEMPVTSASDREQADPVSIVLAESASVRVVRTTE